MSGWDQRILGNSMMQSRVPQQAPQFANPMQKMGAMLQAMRNPAQFVRQRLPQIPEEAFNDPSGNAVLQYMMNNMGVTQQDIQNAMNQIPRF